MAHIDEVQTSDEVIQEVRTIKETLARSLNYDVHRILEDARKRQQSSSKKTIAPPVYSHRA
jgi:hypothetical protein